MSINLYELIKKIKYVGFSPRLVKNFAMYIPRILPLLAEAFKLTKVEYLPTPMKATGCKPVITQCEGINQDKKAQRS